MPSRGTPTLRFLWHPGTVNIFSGYGLALRPAHLVGLLMIDRPEPADPAWLAFMQHAFGDYQLTRMTRGGERGIVCQMVIATTSTPYVRVLSHPQSDALRAALLPLLHHPPAVTLVLAWNQERHCWVSQSIVPRAHLFPLGMVVGTPGAVRALQEAGQAPQEFLSRHVHGDWGEVREGKVPCRERQFRSSVVVSNLLHTYLADADREHFVVFFVDQKNRMIGMLRSQWEA